MPRANGTPIASRVQDRLREEVADSYQVERGIKVVHRLQTISGKYLALHDKWDRAGKAKSIELTCARALAWISQIYIEREIQKTRVLRLAATQRRLDPACTEDGVTEMRVIMISTETASGGLSVDVNLRPTRTALYTRRGTHRCRAPLPQDCECAVFAAAHGNTPAHARTLNAGWRAESRLGARGWVSVPCAAFWGASALWDAHASRGREDRESAAGTLPLRAPINPPYPRPASPNLCRHRALAACFSARQAPMPRVPAGMYEAVSLRGTTFAGYPRVGYCLCSPPARLRISARGLWLASPPPRTVVVPAASNLLRTGVPLKLEENKILRNYSMLVSSVGG
ncbi:hypothetical protein DFH09DRAFT_1089032 [Mycena vulgaris]|nr:hypothetical protein DFH09DRAFT_1089032 [Mycena vulgaris]